jgi:hypothetical protein
MFDQYSLIFGEDLQINSMLTVHNPTIREITQYVRQRGEDGYFGVVTALTSSPFDHKVALYDAGIDYESISEFDFFALICKAMKPDETSILLGDLDLSGLSMMINTETKVKALADADHNFVIDEPSYYVMADFIRQTHGIEKTVVKPGDKQTKKYFIERDRRKMALRRNKKYEPVLPGMISALVNCSEFKYDYASVNSLTISMLNDALRQVNRLTSYHHLMSGICAGTIDSSKVSKSEMTWFG